MRTISLLFVVLFFIKPIFVSALASDRGDWQTWPRVNIEGRIAPKWKAYLDEEFRIGDDISDLYFHRTDVGLTYSCLSWLDLGLHYWQQYSKKDDNWVEERKPHFNVTMKWEYAGFVFQDRNRIERRFVQDKESFWRYRNRLKITPPIKLTRYGITPYLAEEIFIDFTEGELSRGRVYTGFKIKLLQKVTLDLYYLLQRDKRLSDWANTYVWGSMLKIQL